MKEAVKSAGLIAVPALSLALALCTVAAVIAMPLTLHAAEAQAGNTPNKLISVDVSLGDVSINKVPFLIAADTGIYAKNGLEVHQYITPTAAAAARESGVNVPPEYINADIGAAPIVIGGGSPTIYRYVNKINPTLHVVVSTTETIVRDHVIATPSVSSMQDLKGKRIGYTAPGTVTNYDALAFVKQMGWQPGTDVTMVDKASSLSAIKNGKTDAIVGSAMEVALAQKENLKDLGSLAGYNIPLAGSGVMVKQPWLDANRDTTARFVKATVEATALMKSDKKVFAAALAKWFNITDPQTQDAMFAAVKEFPAKPYPSMAGIKGVLAVYDSPAMREHKAEEFYDNSFIAALDKSGYLDKLDQPQTQPEYLTLGRANSALYRPESGTPHIAFLVMHRVADFMRHPACGQLSARGFMVLCINPTAADNEAIVDWDQTMLDVKAGVEYLRKQPGITKVVLFGHSGGGSVMAAYQATAEQGFAYCRGADKIVNCGDSLAHLPPADGIVFADAHPSDGVMKMRDLNPAIVQGKDGSVSVRADLDPFNPANGFVPVRSHYSSAFRKRYSEAQASMMAGLIERAKKQQEGVKRNGLNRANADMMLIPTTKASAWIARLDPDFDGARNTVRPEKLLQNDGSIVTQMITSVAVTSAPADLKTLHTDFFTTKAFLAAHAIRAKDSQGNVDYCSTNSASICAVQYVSVPVMISSMGGYMFVADGERLYDHSASKDKDFVVIEGAVHYFTACTACEKTPGQYGNSRTNLFDYIRDWTNKHFPG